MSTVDEIEAAISQLPKADAFALAERLNQRLDAEWDDQFEKDVASGRLDQVAEEALREYRTGATTEFPQDEK